MSKYIIERGCPGAGRLSPDELQMGPRIQRVDSFVTVGRPIVSTSRPTKGCSASTPQKGGLPANRISAVLSLIDLTTAE